jgi:hypothetical protein
MRRQKEAEAQAEREREAQEALALAQQKQEELERRQQEEAAAAAAANIFDIQAESATDPQATVPDFFATPSPFFEASPFQNSDPFSATFDSAPQSNQTEGNGTPTDGAVDNVVTETAGDQQDTDDDDEGEVNFDDESNILESPPPKALKAPAAFDFDNYDPFGQASSNTTASPFAAPFSVPSFFRPPEVTVTAPSTQQSFEEFNPFGVPPPADIEPVETGIQAKELAITTTNSSIGDFDHDSTSPSKPKPRWFGALFDEPGTPDGSIKSSIELARMHPSSFDFFVPPAPYDTSRRSPRLGL